MSPGRLIDVSLPIEPGMPVFPGDPAVTVETAKTWPEAPYHVSRFACGSHTGTHVDAPAHFIPGGTPLEGIPLERWNGPAWVLEVPAADAVEVTHLEAAWPDAPVERLLLKTPNSALWGTPEAGRQWQALSLPAAWWLIERGVRLVGIDALSIESGETDTHPVHLALLSSDVLVVEGLDLREVAPGPWELVCLPLRLQVPDGSPARVALRRAVPS